MRNLFRLAALGLLGLVAGMPVAQAFEEQPGRYRRGGFPVFESERGLVVMEVESARARGDWEFRDRGRGFTGDGYYLYTGPNSYNRPGRGVLRYGFEVDRAGQYHITVRSRRVKRGRTIRDDLENDFWVRIDGGEWTKMRFTGPWGRWVWADEFDYDDPKPIRPSTVRLRPGEHVLEIAGRSENVFIDRIHINRGQASKNARERESYRLGDRRGRRGRFRDGRGRDPRDYQDDRYEEDYPGDAPN